MFIFIEFPEQFDEANTKSKELAKQLRSRITPTRENILIEAGTDLFAQSDTGANLYFVRDGSFSFSRGERVLFHFEPNDFVGLPSHRQVPDSKIGGDFAVYVDEYRLVTFYEAVFHSPELSKLWSEYLSAQLSIMSVMASALVRSEIRTNPSIRYFEPGETIIQEGDSGSEVYTMVDGHASVYVNGVQVGHVLPDEIFGALAALTGSPRTAKVVASESCMVATLPRENFIDLIEGRPTTILKMVKDMARTIVNLNAQVVSHGKR